MIDAIGRRGWKPVIALATLLACGTPQLAWAQYAGLSGVVRDAQGGVIARAEVQVVEQETSVASTTQSNGAGLYTFPAIKAAPYRLVARAPGFAETIREVVLQVDQRAVLDIVMDVAGQTERVEVAGTRPFLGTTDGSVATVIDRSMADALPTRGRSFSALAELVPGVVRFPAAGAGSSGSDYAVNGQRDTSNSLTVDGVAGQSELGQRGVAIGAGTRPATTATGSVNGGVSLDAVQEFRVQTSTFAAEFGRTPGAQISLVTRSGSNRYTGGVFEQYRNDAFVANDWFSNRSGLRKPETAEHQFGGSLGGPIVRRRLFFFATYEGLRLDRPRIRTASVPSLEVREQSGPLQSILRLYPEPTGPTRPDLTAMHEKIYGERYTSDTWGLRIDHALASGVQLFGRYARTPSFRRNEGPVPSLTTFEQSTYTLTTGMTATIRQRALLDVRANYGKAGFGLTSDVANLAAWFPSTVPSQAKLRVGIDGLDTLELGQTNGNAQRQGNLVAALSYLAGRHQLKTGVDYRWQHPEQDPFYELVASFGTLQQAVGSTTIPRLRGRETYGLSATFRNLSFYVQDTWRVKERLSATYGIRWDVNPAPRYGDGNGPLAAVSFGSVPDITLSRTPDVPLWRTNYGNLYPRFGASYSIDREGKTTLSGGVGIFGDLEGAATGSAAWESALERQNVPLPLSASDVPVFGGPNFQPPYFGFSISVIDPNLETPRTTQWNLSLQRAVGRGQVVSMTYVGARGSRLLQGEQWGGVNPSFVSAFFVVTASARSTYEALQAQYRARFGPRLNVLGAYTLASARDNASSTLGSRSPELATSQNDIRHSGSIALSWTLPTTEKSGVKWLVNGWSLDAIGTARSAYPFTIVTSQSPLPGEELLQVRPNLVPGIPVTLKDSSAPGGRRFNRDAFVAPPPGEQGNTARNGFRGFPMHQMDAALQRTIPLPSAATLRLRIDVFNVFNTPVFATPFGLLSSSFFGVSNATAVQGIGQLYQPGGPRSATLSLRFSF